MEREPIVQVVDGLGHDLPASSAWVRDQMLAWLELETLLGDITPGLALLRDELREELGK